MSKKISSNIIIGESIGIFMRELNKVHDIYAQFMSDKKNKGMIHNLLQSFTNGALVHLIHFPCTVSVIQFHYSFFIRLNIIFVN